MVKNNLRLSKNLKNVTIIQGFPGFGLVGTIATEYLIEHLHCELLTKYWFEELPATITIHDGKLIHPIGIYYNKKYNLVIIHSILSTAGIEWKVAELIDTVAQQTKAKEIISLEGVSSPANVAEPRAFYYSTNDNKKLTAIADELKEGIIIGVTSALLLKSKTTITALFADTHSQLPDSKAAAKLIVVLDKYIGLNIDPKPLFETAKKFEEKIKAMLEKGLEMQEDQKKKQLNYVG